MPRSRFVWQVFAGIAAMVTAMLAGCFWLASLQLAQMVDRAQLQRVADVAETLARRLAAEREPREPAGFAAVAGGIPGSGGVRVELLGDDGAVLATAGTDGPDAPRAAADTLVAEARWGRSARGSRYDAASARRILEVAAPVEPQPGQIEGIVRAMADTRDADAELKGAQRLLLGGLLAWTAAALVAAWLVANRLARPVAELSAAASRLAEGDVDAAIPLAESAELASFADAIAALREQLVERGLTIGRQDTRQEAVLASMIEGVLAVDGRQRVVGMNRAAAELLAVDPGRVSRRPLQEVIRNPDLRRFALRAIDCREPVEDDLVLPGPRDRTIRLRGTALRDMSGEGGAVIVLNDVTEVKRLENVRRDFVANVSHELKTPIASIKGFVETLLDGAAEDPADRRRFLDIVARQADRLESIIEDLLALSRIEQSEGAGNLPREPVAVAEVLAAVNADCLPRAADRSIQLELDCPDGLVAEVNAPLLEQAVINLVDNAIKYSEPGRTVRLTAAGEPPGAAAQELRIVVADEGCGIDADHLPRLFERFYRVDKARSRKLGGTGLGLSIVKHIVQAHDGTVAVESTPGVGSTFTIRLPLGSAAAASIRSRTA